jgi:Glyoxalase/Bleomycin resistance protein/Dioxygenase superfamily
MATATPVNVPLLTNAYHVGVRVVDLERAMRELDTFAGLTWCSVQDRQQRVWTHRDGAFTTPLRFTYSAQGPVHVELLQGEPGTVWDAGAGAGLHHTGVWVDDVGAETGRLVEAGWSLAAAQAPPEDGFGFFTYVQAADGFILELVDVALRPMFERWWDGGPLG